MSEKNRPLAWNGGVKPKPPSEGFATSVAVDVSGGALTSPSGPEGLDRPALGDSFLEQAEGPQVEVRRMGERTGPEVIRPSGRVRLTRT